IKYITDNYTYLDVCINTNANTHCIEHEATRNTDFSTRNIREWCETCSEISYIKNYYNHPNDNTGRYIFTPEDCKLCGNKVYQICSEFKLCSDCYLISSGWVESTLTKKQIPIIYLPWWDATNKSRICNHYLKFVSDRQKWCPSCFTIYVGCRYCLTTNIIFGITDQSQCQKCKEISKVEIDITNITSGNRDIDEFLVSTRTNIGNHKKIVEYIENVDDIKPSPSKIYGVIEDMLKNVGSKRMMEWIPYHQLSNFKQIDKGGFGIIYKAIWLNKTTIAVKKFLDSSYFLNEVGNYHVHYVLFNKIIY